MTREDLDDTIEPADGRIPKEQKTKGEMDSSQTELSTFAKCCVSKLAKPRVLVEISSLRKAIALGMTKCEAIYFD